MSATTHIEVEYDYLVKCVVIGDSGVGKSCLLRRFTENSYIDSHIATIGVDFEIRTVRLLGKSAKLQIWDTAGQDRFRCITRAYYRNAQSIMIVFDVTNMESFQNVREWMKEVRTHAPDDCKVILVGNKSDMTAHRAVDKEDAERLAQELGLPYVETSARHSTNVEEAFKTLTEQFVAARIKQDQEKEKEKATEVQDLHSRSLYSDSFFSCCRVM